MFTSQTIDSTKTHLLLVWLHADGMYMYVLPIDYISWLLGMHRTLWDSWHQQHLMVASETSNLNNSWNRFWWTPHDGTFSCFLCDKCFGIALYRREVLRNDLSIVIAAMKEVHAKENERIINQGRDMYQKVGVWKAWALHEGSFKTSLFPDGVTIPLRFLFWVIRQTDLPIGWQATAVTSSSWSNLAPSSSLDKLVREGLHTMYGILQEVWVCTEAKLPRVKPFPRSPSSNMLLVLFLNLFINLCNWLYSNLPPVYFPLLAPNDCLAPKRPSEAPQPFHTELRDQDGRHRKVGEEVRAGRCLWPGEPREHRVRDVHGEAPSK